MMSFRKFNETKVVRAVNILTITCFGNYTGPIILVSSKCGKLCCLSQKCLIFEDKTMLRCNGRLGSIF